MNLYSIKTRILGSYLFLMALFLMQLPMVYYLMGGMGQQYTVVNNSSSLSRRAVELNYLLTRHILNGEEDLEEDFQKMKEEFTRTIEGLKRDSGDIASFKEPQTLKKFGSLNRAWLETEATLDKAMESGDSLRELMRDVEKTTYPVVYKMNSIVAGFVSLKDPSYGRSIDLAGLQRMRTVNMAYLMERYARSGYERKEVSALLAKTMSEFENTLKGLRLGSVEMGLKPVNDREIMKELLEAEGLWAKRKTLIAAAIKNKDTFDKNLSDLINTHTPGVIAAADGMAAQIGFNGRNSVKKVMLTKVFIILLTIVVTLFSILYTMQHLVKPILKMKDVVESYADGDLTKKADFEIKIFGKRINDEMVDLKRSIDVMASQMSGVIGRISGSSSFLAAASEKFSYSSKRIADGADRQSVQIEHVASAMEEMSASSTEIAKNSLRASEAAVNARRIAGKGGGNVNLAISAMQEVSASNTATAETVKRLGNRSEEIDRIISVISEIAEQTNLLALNAAIEAARAGEQGRGFSVVADEVKKLAQRAVDATVEISEMIRGMQADTTIAVNAIEEDSGKVKNGVELVLQSGEAFRRILVSIEDMTGMISQIATAAEEQSTTAGEITLNINSIAEVAKSNVRETSEVSNASNEMADLVAELRVLVSRFKLEAEEPGVAKGLALA